MGSQSKVQDSQDPSQEHSQTWLRLDPSFPCFPFIFSTSSSSSFFSFFFYYNMYNTISRENPRESNRKDQFRSHGVLAPFQGSSSSCYTRILPSQRQSVNNIVADCILGIGKSWLDFVLCLLMRFDALRKMTARTLVCLLPLLHTILSVKG